jgi:hypothetical protein
MGRSSNITGLRPDVYEKNIPAIRAYEKWDFSATWRDAYEW